tara:strand:- start:880 stop:1761 length:882 start_codon:yes stop_codon:yes gene_type:complete
MKTIPIAMCVVSLLLLTACSSDSGEEVAIESSSPPLATNTGTSSNVAAGTDSRGDTNVNAPAPGATQPRTYSGFDIAGLYLGMSPEEVTAALKDFDPTIVIKQDTISFTYNALGKRHQTDPYAHYMVGNIPGGDVSLDVRYSYPPEPLEVVMVSRSHRQQVEPVSQALYVESLVGKYGTPTQDSGSVTNGQRVERTLQWAIGDGTTQCLPDGAYHSTPPILERIQRRLPDASSETVDTCASTLRYVLQGDPVIRANGGMFDVAAAANAEFAHQAWIQSLIDEKSKTGTEKPKL